MPLPEEKILLNDELLVAPVAPRNVSARNHDIRGQKIVLIDDNPVIRRLYTRLFQKAGFDILTASTGNEGLALIEVQRPDAAVVDFHLPDMTGLQICQKIRESKEMQNIKLFLFTGDDEEMTREEALRVGVDTVVIKSPEAATIINTVKARLKE